MTLSYRRTHLSIVSPLLGLAAIFGLWIVLGGARHIAYAAPGDTCFATPDGGGTVYAGTTSAPVQEAVHHAGAGGTVLIAGTCAGVQTINGTPQTVYITDAVTLRGGYTETDWTTSDPTLYPTVLDAQAGGRVIRAAAALTVENLTIQNGNTTGNGGGIQAASTLVVSRTQVLSSTATGSGGGAHATGAATVYGSHFENNRAAEGGGLWAVSTLVMTATEVISNEAVAESGGGAYAEGATLVRDSYFERNRAGSDAGGLRAASTLTLEGTSFVSNTTAANGGGVYVDSTAMVTASDFISNTAGDLGGGLYAVSPATISGGSRFALNVAETGGGLAAEETLTVLDTVFEENQAWLSRGGAFYALSTLTMTNTRVLRNTANNGGGGGYVFGTATVADSYFEGNESTALSAGALSVDSWLLMRDTQVVSNRAHHNGGGVRVNGAATVIGSRFERNVSATSNGGGIWVDTMLTMRATEVLSNTAGGAGGGIYAAGAVTVSNSLLVGNSSDNGGGIAAGYLAMLLNSTLAANEAENSGGGLSISEDAAIANSILWANTPNSAVISGGTNITRSIIQDGELGGIDVDPLFMRNPDVDAGDLGNLRLRQNSPAIDAGDDAAASALTTDLDGVPRFIDALWLANNGANVVDIGAYELHSVVLPLADVGGPYTTDEGGTIALDGSGSASVVGIVAYAWDCEDDGTFDIVSDAATGYSCSYADSIPYTLRLVITESGGLTGTDITIVTVNNLAPEMTAPADQTTTEGSTVFFELGSFTDAGAEGIWSLIVDWGDGSENTEFDVKITGPLDGRLHSYADNGSYTVTVTVTDKDGDADSDTFNVDVSNVAPEITAPAAQTATVGVNSLFSLGSFTDPGPDTPWSVTVDWGDESADTLFNVDSPGDLGSRLHTYATAGSYTVTVTVDDGDDVGIATFQVDVLLPENHLPSFTSSPPTTVTVGFAYTYALSATDPDAGDTLEFTAPILPAWLTLADTDSGALLSGTPADSDVGDHPVTLEVTDDRGGSATQTFTITVFAAPVMTTTGRVEGTVVDEQDAPVEGAIVTLTDETGQVAAELTLVQETDAEGAYRFADVPAGTYTLTVAAEGYLAAGPISVTVSEGETVTVDPIVLEPEGAALYLPQISTIP